MGRHAPKPPRHDPPSAGPAGPRHKVLGPDALLAAREAARAAGRRVVQCHGCFDIVHPGHIRHLRFAKSQGDILLVSITGDDEVRKGTGRPLIPQELRAENLAELDCVDWVHIEPNPTATGLIERVRPDIYIKGREYETIDDPRFEAERRAVERHGGRVVFSSGDVVFSSTALIDAMQESIDPYHRRLSHLVGQPELAPARLDELVGAMRGKRVVIVGEVITDTYVFCDRPDVAGESPMLTLRPLEERAFEGGAAILARHAAALGARPVLVTRLPDDEGGERVAAALTGEGVELRALQSPTPVAEKRRFLVGATKMLKLDNVPQPAWDTRQRDELVELATSTAAASPTDAAIIADFGLGLLSAPMIESLTAGLRPHVGVLAGDVSGRRSGLLAMRGMDVIAPSESELRDAMGNYTDGLPAVVWRALEKTGGARAIVTMAAEGLVAFEHATPEPNQKPSGERLRGEHVPSLTPHAVDALGCGDALLTTAALALAAGAGLLPAAFLGSIAASIEAARIGNLPVDAASVRREIRRVHASHLALAGPGVIETRRVEMPTLDRAAG